MEIDQIIRCKRNKKEVLNENTVVSKYWEQINGAQQTVRSIKPVNEVIDLVKKARKTIYILSPKITSGELRQNLKDMSQKGVRIYVLTTALETQAQNKMFIGIELVREKADVHSTCVVIDPKTESVDGLWFPGELTKHQPDLPFILHLSRDQSVECWAHFSYWFWQAEGKEVYREKIRSVKPFVPAPPEIRPNLAHTFRTENPDEFLGSIPAEKIWLTEKRPAGMELYCLDVNEVVVPLSPSSWPVIDAIADTADKIYGSKNFPFNYAAFTEKNILFATDLGFILHSNQERAFEDICGEWGWIFRKEGRIGDIHQTIHLMENDTISRSVEVLENQLVELERVSCKDFDEWIKGGITPEIPQNMVYSRLITYQWNLCPPLLPEDAKKHVLYQKWNEFTKEVREYSESLIRNLEVVEASMGELQKITHANQFSIWKDSVKKIAESKWDKQTKESAGSLLDELTTLSDAIQEKVSELQKDAEKSSDEFSASGKGKPSGLSNMRKINFRGDIKKIREKIPRKPIPEIGTLFYRGHEEFLAITEIDQIEQGKIIAKGFPVKLVAKPEE